MSTLNYLLIICFLIKGGFAAFELCDYYQELQPNVSYYVYSAGYPNKYSGGSSCRWIAKSPPGTKVFLVCETVEIPNSANCVGDKLAVSLTGNPLLLDANTYCGNGRLSVTSEKNEMAIAYTSVPFSSGGRFTCSIGVEKSTLPPKDCKCGWQNMVRIVGGTETGVNEYPMMCGLIDVRKRMQFCGATIISEKYAITAAHCLTNKQTNTIALLVGDHDLSTGKDTNSAQLYELDLIKYHPDYNTVTHVNDIALTRTAKPIIFNKNVGPACLPILNIGDSFYGKSVVALGWGSTEFGGATSDKLMGARLEVISNQQCRQAYNGNGVITDNQVCTYADNKDSCQSDSGGPILWRDVDTGYLKLVGVISYGINCASGYPGVNTRITAYVDWIQKNTGDQYCAV